MGGNTGLDSGPAGASHRRGSGHVRLSSRAGLARALRLAVVFGSAALLSLSVYGTLVPASPRCSLPGAIACPGGVLGPAVVAAGAGNEWFDVTMYDWGFWIDDSTTGANVSGSWNVFEGYTIHVNATSVPADSAIGGEAYHGLGVELNATGQQLMSLAAPVGQWVSASFVAPTTPYYHQHIWCTIYCGPGHSSQQEHNLNIIPAVALPLASASANLTLGPAPLTVGLTGSATSGTPPYNFSWSFGDGSSVAYGASAGHVYTLGGIYYATLTVTDAKANQGQATVTITVLSSAPLVATLTALPSEGLAPFGTTLSVVAHGGTPPYNYTWAYGDGASGSAANLSSHLYTAPGVYAVAVNVTDAGGAHARALASITVLPASGSLSVSINATPANGTTPLQSTMTATASGGTAPYSFSWVLGDGSTAVGASVDHVYNQTGCYTVAVFVSDTSGRGGLATLAVPVTAPSSGGGGGGDGEAPAASGLTIWLTTTPSAGPPPLTVETLASVEYGTGLNESVSWDFGDGGTSTGLVASHTFTTAGTYTVTASVSDSGGNSGAATAVVRVAGPSMSLVLNATAGDSPLSVMAGATLTGGTGIWGPVGWSWGDGLTSAGFLVSHAYAANLSGTYTIDATATDSGGNTVTGSIAVALTGPPVASLAVQRPGGNSLPVQVSLTLTVTGGTGGYATSVLWSFGDLTGTRGPPTETHSYNRTGHFRVVAETNDSAGRIAIASAWVNLSSATNLPHVGGGRPVWELTGVSDPMTAAFVMMGLVAVTGLIFTLRKGKRQRERAAIPTSAPRTRPAPSSRGPKG